MQSYKLLTLAVAAFLGLVLVGCGANRHASVIHEDTYATTTSATGERSLALADSADLIGMDIVGSDNETVGVLDDIVVHRDDGRIAYGVVAYGGFVGVGEKFHAISWDSFTLRDDDGKRILAVNFNEEALKGVPGFSKDQWPLAPTFIPTRSTAALDTSSPDIFSDRDLAMGDQSVDEPYDDLSSRESAARGYSDSYGYIGEDTRGDASATTGMSNDKLHGVDALVGNGQLVRLNKFVGWDFHHGDANIGEIEQAIVDMKADRLAYLVVSFDGTIDQLDDRVGLFPWTSVSLLPRDTAISLRNDVGTSGLVAMTYNRDDVPDLTDVTVSQQIYAQFQSEPYWEGYGYFGDDASRGAHEFKEDVKEGARDVERGARNLGRDIDRQY